MRYASYAVGVILFAIGAVMNSKESVLPILAGLSVVLSTLAMSLMRGKNRVKRPTDWTAIFMAGLGFAMGVAGSYLMGLDQILFRARLLDWDRNVVSLIAGFVAALLAAVLTGIVKSIRKSKQRDASTD